MGFFAVALIVDPEMSAVVVPIKEQKTQSTFHASTSAFSKSIITHCFLSLKSIEFGFYET